MLKRIIIIVLSIAVILTVTFFIFINYTQSFSPKDTAKISHKGLEMSVTYCKPSKKGRVIFGELVPFGKVWRTGANSATEINLNRDVKFGNKDLAAGNYVLFTIPEKDKWTVIINKGVGQWGAFSYDEKLDVIRTEVVPEKTTSTVEQFTIDLKSKEEGVGMEIMWDDTKVVVPIQ